MRLSKIVLAVLSGLLLGLSRFLIIGFLGYKPIDSTGLSGLLILVGFVPLILASKDARPKQVFGLALIAAAIQYASVLDWAYVVFNGYGGMSAFSSILILALFILVSALFMASVFALAAFLSRHTHLPYAVLLAAALCSAEYIREFFPIGGMPFGSAGYALVSVPVLVQSASLVGVDGLAFLIVLFNVLLADIGYGLHHNKRVPIGALVSISLLSVSVLGFGIVRLHGDTDAAKQRIRVALLRPDQKTKSYSEAISRFRDFQNKAVDEGAELVVWPETAFPFLVTGQQKAIVNYAKAAPIQIISAIVREKPGVIYNSALLVDSNFNIKGRYDKIHLLPFAEYIPKFVKVWMNNTLKNRPAFSEGTSREPISASLVGLGILKMGFNICLETAFPEITRSFVLNGADLMIAIGDERSGGLSSAHRQYLHSNMMRAVENGRSFVRVVNSGISAFIDSRGRVTQATALSKSVLLLGDIKLERDMTLYTLVGDIVPQSSLFLLICVVAILSGNKLFRRRVASWAETQLWQKNGC